jgi:nitronate monooxygenase
MTSLDTALTRALGIRYPIIQGPMFLVSNPALVAAVSNAGGLGSFPAMNYRTVKELRAALSEIKSLTDKPFGVNLIVNKANIFLDGQLEACAEAEVPFFVTSLGSPKKVIERAHRYGAKVFSDVTTVAYGRKVADLGADGLIAVCAGAGGHAGNISPLVLVPALVDNYGLPVVLAGGVADGRGLKAALALGAAGVQCGTRFIAATECTVTPDYKNAVLKARAEDIILTERISGTPAAVIDTPYVRWLGLKQTRFEKFLSTNPTTKRYMKMALGWRAQQAFGKAAKEPTWKAVWSAGQTVELVDRIQPAAEIVEEMVADLLPKARAAKAAQR